MTFARLPNSTWMRMLTATLGLAALGGGCETDLDCGAIGAVQRGDQCVFAQDGAVDGGQGGEGPHDGGEDDAASSEARPDGSAEATVEVVDTDMDGVPDGEDNCPEDANTDQRDPDGDGLGDACDPDDDADGLVDEADNCPGAANRDQADLDGDGLGDACDEDADDDGVPDDSDPCPLGLLEGPDLDGDGCKDAEDDDLDGDGRINAEDGCPEQPEEIDEVDRDGCPLGIDACPLGLRDGPDADGDGCKDSEDARPAAADTPPRRLYVDANAPGKGSTQPEGWSDAFPHLATALAAAENLYDPATREGVQVWVAAGTYRPDEGSVFADGDREASFVVTRGVELRGGFRLDEEAGHWVRDAMEDTVLSGDLAGDDDPDSPEAFKTDNVCHVVRLNPYQHWLSISGFVVTGGWAFSSKSDPEAGCSQPFGAGILADTGTVDPSATFQNLRVEYNVAEGSGAGAHIAALDLICIDCAFVGNRSLSTGGGLYAAPSGSQELTAYNIRFAGNVATHGAGLYARGVTRLVNAEFVGNLAATAGSALHAVAPYVSCVHCSWGGNGPADPITVTGSMDVYGSVIWDNAGEAPAKKAGDPPTFEYVGSLVDNGEGDLPLPHPPTDWSPFQTRPDPTNAPYTDGDLRLAQDAPGAVDAVAAGDCPSALTNGAWEDLCDGNGKVRLDLTGAPRLQGSAADLGARETPNP